MYKIFHLESSPNKEQSYANFESWLKKNGAPIECSKLLRQIEDKFKGPCILQMSTINIAALLTAVNLKVAGDGCIWLPPTDWLKTMKLSKRGQLQLESAIDLALAFKMEHLRKRKPYKWTEENVLTEAAKYETLSEFAKGNQSAYKACRRNKACLKKVQEMMFKKKMSKL